jgi:cell division protein FtsW
MALGVILVMAASPAVALIYQAPPFLFVKRHVLFVFVGSAVCVGISQLSIDALRRLAWIGVILGCLLLVLTLLVGMQIKGASRWLNLGSLKLQPSEILRPCLIIVCAWLVSGHTADTRPRQGTTWALSLAALVVFLLLLQPDFGTAFIVMAVLFVQLFLAGLSWRLIGWTTLSACACGVVSFFCLPHVRARLSTFWNPELGNLFEERFQILQSLRAFSHGGLWGIGPGEGTVKHTLPDAHADFIFSVAAEEFGLVFCLALLALYGVIILRALYRAYHTHDTFVALALTGLAAHIGLQVLINVGSCLALIPTKGLPLPLISYGGSSFIGTSFLMGALLVFSRRRPR